MNLDYIEPFVSSTVNVLRAVLHSPVEPGNVSLVRVQELNGQVSVVIGLRDLPGESVILNMDIGSALGICAVMNGASGADLDTAGMDAIGELANMIAGNAITALNERGFAFSVQPPASIEYADLPALTKGLEVFQVPVAVGQGRLTVNFTIRTN